jgi:hypothetical protein
MLFASWHWQSHSEIKVCTVEQPLYTNIVILHSRYTWEFKAELHATLRYCALLYPTVARWVQVFEGVQHCTLLSITCMSVARIEKCLGEDRHWTVKELAKHTGIYGFTVPYFLQQGVKGTVLYRGVIKRTA